MMMLKDIYMDGVMLCGVKNGCLLKCICTSNIDPRGSKWIDVSKLFTLKLQWMKNSTVGYILIVKKLV